MPARALVLFSGGLDSMLAVRVLQLQGIEVEAINFRTTFACCQDQAGRAARQLEVPLTVLAAGDDYLDVIRQPRFGYGRGANPCVDCRIYMFRQAAELLETRRAEFVASGEVLGQRPMSQKRKDLANIAHWSGLDDRLLRPLSARLLPETWPERSGLVDRRRLHRFAGQSRKGLIAFARRLGFEQIPTPSTGCALTEPGFAHKVHDLVAIDPSARRWDFELLKTGRHLRVDRTTKVVLGRNERENQHLALMYDDLDASAWALLEPRAFPGPTALVVGPPLETALDAALALISQYTKRAPQPTCSIDATLRTATGRQRRVLSLTVGA